MNLLINLEKKGIRDPVLGAAGCPPCIYVYEDVGCRDLKIKKNKKKTQPNNCPYNHNILKLYKPKIPNARLHRKYKLLNYLFFLKK